MDNFDLKKYLVENKVTTNSQMMNEYFEEETQDLGEAFAQAGIDMNTPVEVVEAGGGPGGSMGKAKKMDPKALLQMLEKEKASFEADSDEGDAVMYDFEANVGYPGAKLAVLFSDQYEYIIYQK
jgi:ribosomal protein S9